MRNRADAGATDAVRQNVGIVNTVCVRLSAGGSRWLASATRLCYQVIMLGSRQPRRDRLAVLAALVLPLVLTAVLVPFRADFPNTDAALALMLAVVAVAANGYRFAGVLAAISAAVLDRFG